MKIRINKYLSLCGLGSRRKVEELVTSGRITVNGLRVSLSCSVDMETDVVCCDNEKLNPSGKFCYLMLNKPTGYITTSSDEKGRATVMSLIPERYRRKGVMPVGRLDRDTEGLLLFTNDGDLAYGLTRPSFKVRKEYIAELDRPLEDSDRKKMEKGFFLHQVKAVTRPSEITVLEGRGTTVRVVLTEGKKRQIRYSFKNFGYRVVSLKRTAYGMLTLGRLNRGECRQLRVSEVARLKKGILKAAD